MAGFKRLAMAGLAVLGLAACQKAAPAADTSEPEAPATTATIWPASLNVLGDGYPAAGDICRRIGESLATADLLDDSAILVGCPTNEPEAIAAIGGRQISAVDGITLISVPTGDANAGMAAQPSPGSPAPPGDPAAPSSRQPRLVKRHLLPRVP
jgi:hypothetical protein